METVILQEKIYTGKKNLHGLAGALPVNLAPVYTSAKPHSLLEAFTKCECLVQQLECYLR